MKEVTIKKDILLSSLKANKETHVNEYQTALIEWDKQFRKVIKNELRKPISERNSHITLIKPVSYENSYDTAIRMVEMAEETEFVISQSEFKAYILDEWAWKESFTNNTMTYASSKR